MREDGRRTGFILGKTPGLERILLWDDLEGLFKWKVVSARWLPSVVKETALAYNGDACLRFWSGSTIPNGPSESIAYRDPYVVGAGHGVYRVELVFRLTGVSASFGFGFRKWVDGVEREIKFWHGPLYWEWKYLGADGAWHYISGSGSNYAYDCWHRIAFEFKWDPAEYVLLEVDGGIFSLSGVGYYVYAQVVQSLGQGVLLTQEVSGAGVYMYVDDVLVRCK